MTRDFHNSLIQLGNEILSKYECKTPFNLRWNDRLETTAGRWINGRIELSSRLYLKFGEERTKKTFLHELAHHLAYFRYGYTGGHGMLFKRICYAIGGSMSSRQAGIMFADAATKEFCESRRVKHLHKYTCQCGWQYIARRKRNIYRYSCPKCHTSLAKCSVVSITYKGNYKNGINKLNTINAPMEHNINLN